MAKHNAKKTAAPRGPSQRQLRIGEMIRHKLAEMLARSEIHDEDLSSHLISIPEVRVSNDLKMATAYVMPLGGEDVDLILKALERNRRYIRGEISQAVNLKYAPDIRFLYDKSFDEAMRIDALLASERVQKDVKSES